MFSEGTIVFVHYLLLNSLSSLLLLGLLNGTLLLLLCLENRLDNLLFLNQEGTNDAVTNALGAARATIGASDGTSALGDTAVLLGAEVGDLVILIDDDIGHS